MAHDILDLLQGFYGYSHILFCLHPPVIMWSVGLYLNGELWQIMHVYIVYIKRTNIRYFYDMLYQVLVSGTRVVC